nr:hypothetical protein [Pseudohoeflea sp. DP4N28-3]
MFFLVIAVITGVVDAIQSVSSGMFDPTILGQAWFEFSPGTLNQLQAVVQRYVHPLVWDPGAQWLLTQPAAAVFLALSLLFYLLGYRRRKAAGRFAA